MEERRILESWKAIAAYLGRTEKTCRKWEHELGLPVHRLDKSAKAHVFAYADEIDVWKEKLEAAECRKTGRLFVAFALSRPVKLWLGGAGALLFIVLAGFLVRRISQNSRAPEGPPAAKGVAVLPFIDLSPDKSQEHIAEGISDILINTLNRVEGLRIAARTSAFYFKGKDVTTAEIGRRLNVEWILEGSAQVSENRLRVLASLIRAADGSTVWTDRYDRDQFDIFAVEDEIARRVVDNLKVRIMGDKRAPLIKTGTANLEAYNLYLQGRYLWSKRGFDNLTKSVGYFQKAIDLDPGYAQGYAGLSMAYFVLGDNLLMTPHEAFPKAKAFALKALDIDDSVAEAHYSLGGVRQDYEWDFIGAEQEYRRALEINPGDAYVHQACAFLFSAVGKHEEAIEEIKLACALDPLALRIRANVGYLLYFARRFSEAEQVLRKEFEFDPDLCRVHLYLGYVYREMARYEEALEFTMKNEKCASGDPTRNSAFILARMGRPEEARKILDDIEHIKTEYWTPAFLAGGYGWLGDRDKAFSLLEKGYTERDTKMTFLRSDPLFDCLRSDPRFTDLLRRIGLEK